MPEITIDFNTDIWQKLPSTIQRLGENSFIYRFHDQCFKNLIIEKSLPELNILKNQIFLDTATAEGLDFKGEEFGVYRNTGEDDTSFRERIRLLKIIKIYGLSRYAIKLYLTFRTGYDALTQDEYEIAGRIEGAPYDKVPNNSAVITTPKGTYSRGYIKFWNTPPLDTDILYKTLRTIVEPYTRIILTPYTSIEAVKKVLDYYCSDYTLTYARREEIKHPVEKNDGSIIHSTSFSRKAFPSLIKKKPTWNTNPIGIKLHSNPSIPVEDLKKDLEARIPSYSYYIRFSNIDVLLQNYISGTYADITDSVFGSQGSGYFILPSDEDFLVLDVDGDIRVDPITLRWEIRRQFEKKTILIEPIYKKLKSLLSIPFKVYWGSDSGSFVYPRKQIGYMPAFQMDGYIVSQDIIKKHIYIKLFGSITAQEQDHIVSELKNIKPEKDYYFF